MIDFRDGTDTLRNTTGGTVETNAATTTFFFSDGQDRLENTRGAQFTTNNVTTFFFDDPSFFIGPIPGTENGPQYADVFENSQGRDLYRQRRHVVLLRRRGWQVLQRSRCDLQRQRHHQVQLRHGCGRVPQ